MNPGADLARPDLPKPTCRVMLVCGPPAAGKTTYVRDHAKIGDIVIDLDWIAAERGLSLNRPASEVPGLLQTRNSRLAALSRQPAERTAWFVLCAPSPSLRRWWCETLGVLPDDLIVLVPSRFELYHRIKIDPKRRYVKQIHISAVDRWFARERDDNPGITVSGCGADGFPIDPLHPWNRHSAGAY